MDLTIEQTRALTTPSRNGLIESSKRWPHNRVFYEISDEHTMDELAEIERAMKLIESTSCIIFKERTDEDGFIEFDVSMFVTQENIQCRSKVWQKFKTSQF